MRGRVAVALVDILPPLLVTRLLLLAITLSAPHWHAAVPDPPRFTSPSAVAIEAPVALQRWYYWDADWYLRIAGNGPQMGYSRYTESAAHKFGTFAFFPLYPLVVRAAASVVPGALAPVHIGGAPRTRLLIVSLVVSNLLFVLALVALYLSLLRRGDEATGRRAGRRAVWLLCLFPTTVFFSASYSESLFFLFLVLFFLLLDRRRFLLAALCGALAAATRSLGVGLVLPYFVSWAGGRASLWPMRREETGDTAERHGPPISSFADLLPIVIIPLGLVAYMLYLGVDWHNPLLFRDAERAWQRSFAPPWTGIIDGITWSLRWWPHLTQPAWRGLTDALYAVVFLVLTGIAWRGFDPPGRAYAIVFWLYVLCEPQISDPRYPDTLISMPRFLLVLLPLWVWLAGSRRRTLAMAIPSALLLLLYAARWTNGGWIG